MRRVFLLFSTAAIVVAQDIPEKFRLDVWQTQTPKLRIAAMRLPAEDRDAANSAVAEILRRTPVGASLSHIELRRLVSSTRVKLMDLTGDRAPEVIAEGGHGEHLLCSPAGNCPWWVLSKRGTRYIPILASFGQTLGTDCRGNKGQCDIVVFMHGSATQQGIKLYRLSNRKYREIAEYEAIWQEDENGKVGPKPSVTRIR
jgi:hypothetical protein